MITIFFKKPTEREHNKMEFHKPNVSEKLAKELVKKLYGLQVLSIKKMNSFDDQNFHIQVSEKHQNPFITNISNKGYTLKITNTKKSADEENFDIMHKTMVHLNKKGVRAPLPLKNLTGQTWTLEKVPLLNEVGNKNESPLCGIHVLSYISGTPISTITKDILYQWGVLLAEFHNATEDFVHPGLQNKFVFWSLENVPKIKNYLGNLALDKREIINSVLNKYPNEIAKNFTRLPKGVIHGDFNESNVLVQEKVTERREVVLSVDGVLDFEDVHEGTYVWDVAVMLAYTIIECNELDHCVGPILEAPGHALAGYLSKRHLDNLEMALLKMCTECRLSQSLVLGAYSYSQDSSNDYLIKSAKTGWTKLKTLCAYENEELLQKWKDIVTSLNKRIN